MTCGPARDVVVLDDGTELDVGDVADGEVLAREGDAVVGKSGLASVGDVKLYFGFGPGSGWLALDGTVRSRATYADLFDHVTLVKAGCTVSSGSALISVTGGKSQLRVGMYVEGADVPAGTKILSLAGGASDVTLDANCTASAVEDLRFFLKGSGPGDGSTTFDLPDMSDRFVQAPGTEDVGDQGGSVSPIAANAATGISVSVGSVARGTGAPTAGTGQPGGATVTDPQHQHTVTDGRPPYVVLGFAIKT